MEALTLAELKRLCQQRGLAVGGAKAELSERLMAMSKSRTTFFGERESSSKTTATASGGVNQGHVSALFPRDFSALAIPELKQLCRKRALPVGGIKDDLVARLRASDPRNMNLNQLKDRCREAGVPVTGTKSDVVARVMKTMNASTKSSMIAIPKMEKSALSAKPKPAAITTARPAAQTNHHNAHKFAIAIPTRESLPSTKSSRNVKLCDDAIVGKKRKATDLSKTPRKANADKKVKIPKTTVATAPLHQAKAKSKAKAKRKKQQEVSQGGSSQTLLSTSSDTRGFVLVVHHH